MKQYLLEVVDAHFHERFTDFYLTACARILFQIGALNEGFLIATFRTTLQTMYLRINNSFSKQV